MQLYSVLIVKVFLLFFEFSIIKVINNFTLQSAIESSQFFFLNIFIGV